MTILSILLGVFELLGLFAIAGLLLGFVALSRLVEFIITLVHPAVLFLLHQLDKLIFRLINVISRMTSYVFRTTLHPELEFPSYQNMDICIEPSTRARIWSEDDYTNDNNGIIPAEPPDDQTNNAEINQST